MHEVQNAMMLCKAHNKFLYEARPDLFPTGFLSYTEMDLWARFYDEQSKRWKK